MRDHQHIYLDYSASTPTDPRVVDTMKPYLGVLFANTSSIHQPGRTAKNAVERSREAIAGVLNCKPSEIVFTSGGSESDNLAVRGAAWHAREQGRGNHLLTTPVEHPAVRHTVNQLTNIMGFESTILLVDHTGLPNPKDFANACKPNTTIASIIYANNEIGTISPIPQLAAQAKAHNVLSHTDAVQAAGQLTLDVKKLGVDMMSISAHKFYGPKGVGALYIREGLELISSQTGGSHENRRRAGTLNTPGIVGMAKALQIAYEELNEHVSHYCRLRDMLIEEVTSRIPGVQLSGHPEQRLPSHASFVFDDLDSNALLIHLDRRGIAASGGSACKTGNPEPSSTLLAMGYTPQKTLGGLRLTVGRPTTPEDITFAIDVLAETTAKLRKLKKETTL